MLCVNEKSQCQALERTQSMLQMGFGYVEGVTHDYVRHATTTLFAALNVLNRALLATCKPRHRHQEFLSFLREIDKAIRRGSFGSVKQLIKRIDHFVSHYNENCKPFVWSASADSILEQLHRLCSRISGTFCLPYAVHGQHRSAERLFPKLPPTDRATGSR